jgi:hypothetical protein
MGAVGGANRGLATWGDTFFSSASAVFLPVVFLVFALLLGALVFGFELNSEYDPSNGADKNGC